MAMDIDFNKSEAKKVDESLSLKLQVCMSDTTYMLIMQ